jgi:glycosyltransferase involved in cell wall biosynthesis
MLSACDHYLSYTQASTADLVASGFDAAKLTTVHNATAPLAEAGQLAAARRTPFQALFVASLVEDKEPLEAVEIVGRLRLLAPDASLHIVGDGPLRAECERAAAEHHWVRYHGSLRGSSLRDLALTSDFALIPGRVGLAVLEMASAGLPMATSCKSLHGAEIAYLRDGMNGLVLSEDAGAAAKELAGLFSDRPAAEQMRCEAIAIARTHTIEAMAAAFAHGVLASLS